MSDAATVIAPRRAPVQHRPGPPAKRYMPKTDGSPKVKRAIHLMIWGGDDGLPLKRQDAAKAAGLADVTLRNALANPLVLKHYNQQLQVLRDGERVRNLHAAVEIRDDSALKGTAAGGKTRLEAARFIEGRDGPASVQVNVGVNVQPGYQIAMPPDLADTGRQMLKLSGSHANVLDLQADVPTDEPGTP